jgi:hypothetical protein
MDGIGTGRGRVARFPARVRLVPLRAFEAGRGAGGAVAWLFGRAIPVRHQHHGNDQPTDAADQERVADVAG